MNLTDYTVHKVLDHIVGTTTWTKPAAVYLALFLSDPTVDGDQTDEVSGNNYARTVLTFEAAEDRQIVSTADVETPPASASWGTISHYGIMDASTAGNMLFFGALTEDGILSPKAVDTNQTILFAAGQITMVFA